MGIIIRSGLLAACCFVPATAFAAPSTLVGWFDQLPKPPKTAVEAQAKVKLENGQVQVSDSAFANFVADVDAKEAALTQQNQHIAEAFGGEDSSFQTEMNAAAGGDLNDPEFIAKLESMSDAEKIAFAQRMSAPSQAAMKKQRGGVSMMGNEPAAVQAAMTAATNYAQNSTQLMQAMSGPNGVIMHSTQNFEAHAKLDASLDQDAKTCMASGTAEQQTACLQQKTAACWTQHQTLADQQLKTLQTQWQSDYAQSRKAAQDADKTQAPARYGEAATSVAGKTLLLNQQGQLLSTAKLLAQSSEKAWLDSAKWQLAQQQSAKGELSPLPGSCGYVAMYGRSGSNGRSGSTRSRLAPVNDAAKKAQDSAKKVLDWLKK